MSVEAPDTCLHSYSSVLPPLGYPQPVPLLGVSGLYSIAALSGASLRSLELGKSSKNTIAVAIVGYHLGP
jgi:hypothetical protein